MTTDPRIQILVGDVFPAAAIASLDQLHGDASYRVYYRLRLSDGRTYIIMQLPAGTSSASEEITNYSGNLTELPFQNVQRFLKAQDILVPDIIHYSPELHLMVLEDCGDDILFGKVAQVGDDERLAWYGRAVDLLCEMQKRCNGARASDCVALQRSFDATLLNWEFAHFVEYGIEARRGEKWPEKTRKEFDLQTRRITTAIMEQPYGFTHRDYQSRNLLVRGDQLVVIDFQDALRGPFIYDVVALLRDSYVPLSDPVIETMLARYAAAQGMPVTEVRRAFDLVTVQRKLKDAGRFVYIDRVKGNPNYLPFIPTSLGYVREALGRMKGGGELLELLRPYVPEWNP